jgi:hypothetical protein
MRGGDGDEHRAPRMMRWEESGDAIPSGRKCVHGGESGPSPTHAQNVLDLGARRERDRGA